jgi:hypothetical protein
VSPSSEFGSGTRVELIRPRIFSSRGKRGCAHPAGASLLSGPRWGAAPAHSAIPVRKDYTAGEVRRVAQRAKDAAQVRRLLAIAAVLDGASASAGTTTTFLSTAAQCAVVGGM